jgi:hypothetical protein
MREPPSTRWLLVGFSLSIAASWAVIAASVWAAG